MIIQSSEVHMNSSYQKTVYEQASINYTETIGSNFTEALLADKANGSGEQQELLQNALMAGQMKVSTETQKETFFSVLQSQGAKEQIQKTVSDPVQEWADINLSEPEKLEFRSLENLLELISEKLEANRMSADEMFQRLLRLYRTRLEALLLGAGVSGASSGTPGATFSSGITEEWVQETNITDFHAETEETEFQSAGTVTTADGTNIDFDLSFSMSQSFLSYTEVSVNYKQIMMIDPLVVNLDCDIADVSDQKFYFDIDADGEEDNISLLGKMSGFLALDRNGDGTINDGSELFGATSGDGFSELAVFDLDGNGWIDETDEIFNRLKIWKKDDQGNDRLIALGVAGIGAIYLGNVSTKYELKNEERTASNAQIQKSGIFLRENGTAGTIQHVDLAAG